MYRSLMHSNVFDVVVAVVATLEAFVVVPTPPDGVVDTVVVAAPDGVVETLLLLAFINVIVVDVFVVVFPVCVID